MSDRDLAALQERIETLEAELARQRERAPRLRLPRPPAWLLRSLGATVLLVPLAAWAATVTLPHTFTNGTIADADEVNANFDTLVVESNDQDSRLAALESQVAANSSGISGLQSDVATNSSGIATLQTDVATNSSDIGGNTSGIAANATAIGVNTGDIDTLETTFAGVSRAGSLLTFGGMNVQVVSGSGSTSGTLNGLGNLIVGYNENGFGATRPGSHNLVVGKHHEYTSFGGLAAGYRNTVSGNYGSVAGGTLNTAGGDRSSVSGGSSNAANGQYSSISGGRGAAAGGTEGWAAGGVSLVADLLTFDGMNVQLVDGSGDTDGTPNGLGNLIVGYNENAVAATRTGSHNLVVGMDHGYTSYAGLVAGFRNTVTGEAASVSGGRANTASSSYTSVTGGLDNTASGEFSSVSGGNGNAASGDDSSVSGGFLNTASGERASVSGGSRNQAVGSRSSVSGGYDNTAGSTLNSVVGDFNSVFVDTNTVH